MLKVLIVGLGYVGLPIAIAFAKQYNTIGFDIDNEKPCFIRADLILDTTQKIYNKLITEI